MNREQIINQYISVYEGHAMEKEELEIMLNGFADDIVNNLESSLPDNLDEAAEEFSDGEWDGLHDNDGNALYTEDMIQYAYKAGAEWMAKQKEEQK